MSLRRVASLLRTSRSHSRIAPSIPPTASRFSSGEMAIAWMANGSPNVTCSRNWNPCLSRTSEVVKVRCWPVRALPGAAGLSKISRSSTAGPKSGSMARTSCTMRSASVRLPPVKASLASSIHFSALTLASVETRREPGGLQGPGRLTLSQKCAGQPEVPLIGALPSLVTEHALRCRRAHRLLKRLRHLGEIPVAAVRILRQRPMHDFRQAFGEPVEAGVQQRWRGMDDLVDQIRNGFRLEGAPATQELVEDGTHRPHIATAVDRLSFDLFRRHISRRSHHQTGLGLERGVFAPGDTEIEDLVGSIWQDLNISP